MLYTFPSAVTLAFVKEGGAKIPIAPDDLSQQLGIPKENVTVNMPLLGGNVGRKALTRLLFPRSGHYLQVASVSLACRLYTCFDERDL